MISYSKSNTYNPEFNSLIKMIEVLDTEQKCREYLEELRWNGEPVCPHCGSIRENHYKLKQGGRFKGLYKCKDCRERFTIRIGTMFEDSNIKFKKWFLAIYLFSSHKKGISSHQLAKDIDVTQKTAWFMLSRIRNAFQPDRTGKFDGITQVDETFVGGKNQKKSKEKRTEKTQGRSTKTKTVVFGLLSNGIVTTEIVPNTKGKTLIAVIKDMVKEGSIVVSDGWVGYSSLHKYYTHKKIPHNEGLYVKDSFHTNSIEGFWSLLKRGILGIYHSVSPKHLQKYCDEFAFRYNTKDYKEGDRFNLALLTATERITYKALIA
jgi:Transposase and inactivated derivatives